MTKSILKPLVILLIFLANTAAHAILPQMEFYNGRDKEYLKEYCPAVEELYRNDNQTWSAPGGWKSSNPSFMHSLEQFVGAQWVGVNVGDVLCIYAKNGRPDFPVTLQKQIITISPTGGQWSVDQGGYKDCKSNDVEQCAFEEQIQHSTGTLYEDLDFHKGKPVQDFS